MQTKSVIGIVLCSVTYVFFTLTLTSCGLFQDHAIAAVKIRHAAKPHYQADELVEHVAIADIILANPPYDNATILPHLEIIEGYTAQKQKKPITQPVIVLSYTLKNKKTVQRIIAPFNMAAHTNEEVLLNIMNTMDARHYTLQDVSAARIQVISMKPLKLKDKDLNTVKAILDQQLQIWLQEAQIFSPIAEAKAQIELIDFFMNHRMREAAYLSVDNAKQALASGAEHGADPKAEQDLSEQLAGQESQLRNIMPFTAF